MSPFVRARAPELEQRYGLSSSELLAFIDGLNESFMANPALQVTNTIGTIVSFVPLQTAQIVGASLNVAAGLGTAGVSMVRTKRYMKQANETIFKPRGLHAQICKTDKMLSQMGMAGDTAVFAKGQAQAMLSSAQANEPSRHAIARRMQALGDRMGSFAAQRAEKKQLEKLQKQQVKAEERADKDERKIAKAECKHSSADGTMDKIMKQMEDIQYQIQSLDPNRRRYVKHLRELQREYRELERKLQQVEAKGKSRHAERVDKQDRRRDEKSEKRENKEARNINKIYWIVINAEEESALGDDDWASDNSSEVSATYGRYHQGL
ncbi:uncharacterized protein N7496_006385 [Penicillium cataractarum]|uniref:Uncharacterized protein n=1 Tax=Penicillium cataractarum TaxID=2100454 RepID=A0A9W9S1G0_9EURO|nr:uncharacterized protein N7496_006385 [Penicillium cataractarum]KAJ5370293.1 hypothetical protein N7496_006385 [Penicillium cataractarum]